MPPSSNESRFMIVPHRPRARAATAMLVLGWVLSLGVVFFLAQRFAVPNYENAAGDLRSAQETVAELEQRIERLRQRNTVALRSDEVSRVANQALQDTLAERDEEIAALRADVGFYERLVGGSAQRQGLAVHSLALAPTGDGAWRYTLTLTQNLKKASVSKGQFVLAVEGVRDGKLSTLDWSALTQAEKAAPQAFEFKYFQQLEGSVMLPPGFTPHRVKVQLQFGGRESEQVFPWQATQAEGVS
jgi:hypothetical protein